MSGGRHPRIGIPWSAGGYADADVNAYIAALEAADSASLETTVKDAINTLITGIKSDGTAGEDWNSINAIVINSAARTITGCQVAMKGANASFTNVVSGDLTRGLGILGAATKWGDSGVTMASVGSTTAGYMIGLSADYTAPGGSSNFLGRTAAHPRHTLGVNPNLSARLYSSTFYNPTGAVAGSSMTAITVSRETGNLRVRSYNNGTLDRNSTAANTVATPTSGNVLLMVQDETLINPWTRRLTGYVLSGSTGTTAQMDRIVARITTYANAVRAILGV